MRALDRRVREIERRAPRPPGASPVPLEVQLLLQDLSDSELERLTILTDAAGDQDVDLELALRIIADRPDPIRMT